MEICSKCKTPETEALLFEVILPEGIGKICGKCSAKENFPIIKKENFFGDNIGKTKTVRERLIEMSGVKLEERKSDEDLRMKEEALKRIIKQNFNETVVADPNMNKELIDNFNWVIMRARRMKHITQEQLAKSINEPEEAIKMIEKGDVPNKRELIRKLEEFLNVKIRRNSDSDNDAFGSRQISNDSGFHLRDMDNLTVSDLQKIKEDLERHG